MSDQTTLDRMLTHMAWANARLFATLATLPAETLAVQQPGSEWSVAAIAHHLATAAENYARRLHGEPRAEKRELPTTGAEIAQIAEVLAAADARLRDGARQPGDERLTWVTMGGDEISAQRWVLIDQAVHHATEHRAQIAAALAAHGSAAVDLDQLDVWTYNDGLG